MHAPASCKMAAPDRGREGFADTFFKKRGFGKQVGHMIRMHTANVKAKKTNKKGARGGDDRDVSAALDPSQDPTWSVMAQMRSFSRGRRLVIDPRSSRFLPWWDSGMLVALIYVSLVTPFEVGFLKPAGVTPLFVINRCLLYTSPSPRD